MLRSLLAYAHESPEVTALAEASRRSPQRAFVSASLRPYLLSSLIDLDPERPASRTWRRRPTWWACAWPRSTRSWARNRRCS
jgi:hypothetical protein